MTLEEINIVYKEQMKIAASLLIFNDEGKVLLELLNKEKKGGVWVPPGGKLQIGESLRDCAIRETREELGIETEIIKPYGFIEKIYPDTTWTFILYEAKIISGTPKNLEQGKIIEFGYQPIEKYAEYNNINLL